MSKRKNFKFIDLFAGIGGMRMAFERAGGECVFSSEWNKFAQRTYEANFGEIPAGDITQITASDIPDHDVLVGGFPCQPFSIAGVSSRKSLNRPHGFEDQIQGTLFFDIARIIKEKKPAAFVLENVKNLGSHDKGRTFKVILKILRDDLGYDVYHKVVDASRLVPQHRERIYIVGFKTPTVFEFPELEDTRPQLADILEKDPEDKYTLTDGTWNSLQRHLEKHRKLGNGFGYSLADVKGITKTLSARYYKDGAEILIPQGKKNPRRLTPRECARLMGFPEKFKISVSDNQAYRQFGNAVVVPVVEKIARSVAGCLTPAKKRITLFDYAK
ncbi:MAG: DNA (cytosine-5-)-methyltransferase [Thaumarchaeota archaeon]|nr:DNA (cytosine-5-)-methyltransferase [Nitrososphaerota archaeon]MBI3641982.1 DNA (cytosine-5-)-methyltransferase [Nitrososphaerota archaeon]